MHRNSARNAGFTLTELLVASAIFLILMTALVTLFNAAITSARQGYASINAGETGRQANMVISRDLVSSFTAREHGDVYNFYGRHDGFMFVGALDNGQIGRVTYVTHPIVGTRPVRTTIREKWGVVEDNIRRHITRITREDGYVGQNVEAEVGRVLGIAAAAYHPNFTGGAPYPRDVWIDFEVEVDTESLIRYEESAFNDLDTFRLQVEGNLTDTDSTDDVYLNWLNIDPRDQSQDVIPAAWESSQGYMQKFLYGALNPTWRQSPSPNDTLDLRYIYDGLKASGAPHPVTGETRYPRVLGPQVFDQLLKIRKREFWLRMLSGEDLRVLGNDINDGAVGFWNDEGYNGPNNRRKRVINEYVVAEGIVSRARLLTPITEAPLFAFTGVPIDILDADVKFYYGDGESAPINYFNDIQNLRNSDNPDGTADPMTSPYADGVVQSVPMLLADLYDSRDFIEADSALADALVGSASRVDPNNPTQTIANRALLGSPLRPRIPQVVTTDFWVTRTRTRPGAPDIIKRFTQTIQIPAAHGRSVSTTVARGPGASL